MGTGRARRWLRGVPAPMLLVLVYLVLMIAVCLALKLPIAAHGRIGWMDALFTAASAATINGLVVLDTGADLTLFGQAVILIAVQISGLGIMTFAVLILAALGLPVGLTGRIFLRDDLNQPSVTRILRLVSTIFKTVLAFEALGAAMLAAVFVPLTGWGTGLWHAVFHSVMAFNNAGFTTLPEGLIPLARDPLINLVIPVLAIIGGLGYAVLSDIFLLRKWRKFTLTTKLMLSGTAALLVISTLGFAVLEWANPATLGAHDGVGARMMISWFQAVTTRSVGFNTVDIAALNDATTLMFMALMMIGGGPTSTAGGIKVTAFLVVLLATVMFFRRRTELTIFGRSMGDDQVLKVMALATVALLVAFAGMFLLVLTRQGEMLDIAFEVASALGSTGLSRGATWGLDGVGQAIVIVLMFAGRVGPLALGFFITTQIAPRVRYPAGQIYLG
ncbi:MAG: potassium transporter TrkG [Paracoccaceae bacterium]